MSSPAKSKAKRRERTLHELNVVLVGYSPLIWRRLQVPSTARLDWLHAVLQIAIGWTNSHLHHFLVGEDRYLADTLDQFIDEGDEEARDECEFTLAQIAPHEGDAFCYEYDFGDSWRHEITVEKILPMRPEPSAAKTACCIAGVRACPPEDCGGIWGYANLIKIVRNRKHPEHEEMKEWLGRDLEPEAFDLTDTNRWLGKLPWPRVTEEALRKVLMARDRYAG